MMAPQWALPPYSAALSPKHPRPPLPRTQKDAGYSLMVAQISARDWVCDKGDSQGGKGESLRR